MMDFMTEEFIWILPGEETVDHEEHTEYEQ
jgi:hypothetical protein